MKLVYAIVQNDDSKRLLRELTNHRISVTRISSTGGFLHNGNSTLMIGVEADRLQETLDIIKENPAHERNTWLFPPQYPDISTIPPPLYR